MGAAHFLPIRRWGVDEWFAIKNGAGKVQTTTRATKALSRKQR